MVSRKLPRILIAAPKSGSGKTLISCGLMQIFKEEGKGIRAYKCGPDYIDPMFHESVLGVPSRNLDLFLQGETGIRRSMNRCSADFGLLEGAMGYYDGIGGTEEGSAWATARVTGTPAALVLRPKGSALTLAAQVRGMKDFRPESGIRALLLTDCRESLYRYLKPVLERETGLPVLGFLPPVQEAEIGSRHLGLLTAAEISDFTERLGKLAELAEQHIDLDALLSLAGETAAAADETAVSIQKDARCRIAVARDEAFCFCYADSLDALRDAGAELCFFSPMRDPKLPEDIHGLYLPGGYPELHTEALEKNSAMRREVAAAVAGS